jgi:hypothetical protein
MVRKEGIYYIAGWLLKAVHKEGLHRATGTCLAKLLPQMGDLCHEISEEARERLPTGKTKSSEKFSGRLQYPTKEFYRFVVTIEKICEKSFVN